MAKTSKTDDAGSEQTQADDTAAGEQTVQLQAPYGFYDENGELHYWHEGAIVTGSDAATLIERQAPVEIV